MIRAEVRIVSPYHGQLSNREGGRFVEKNKYAEFLAEDCIPVSSETLQYSYHAQNEYQPCGNKGQNTYHKSRENKILLLKDRPVDYQEIEQYFGWAAEKFHAVQIDGKKLSGMPAIRNTRIPVSLIVACFKDGMTSKEICEEYHLTEKEIGEAMEYVINVLDIPYQEEG